MQFLKWKSSNYPLAKGSSRVCVDEVAQQKSDIEEGRFARREIESEHPYLLVDARYEKLRESGVNRSRSSAHGYRDGPWRLRFWSFGLPPGRPRRPYACVEDVPLRLGWHNKAGSNFRPFWIIPLPDGGLFRPPSPTDPAGRDDPPVSSLERGVPVREEIRVRKEHRRTSSDALQKVALISQCLQTACGRASS
jgi:hypothetical protein